MALMSVADLHMHIDDMGAPDAPLQMGALVVRSRPVTQPLLSGQPVVRGGGAHPKCAASGLQFPSTRPCRCS